MTPNSSIGNKVLVACTGLFLYLFVIVHLIGNLQVFLGPEPTNAYAAKLKSMPLVLWPARAALLALFLVHIATGIRLAIANRRARPAGYAKKSTVQATFASRTMVQSGIVIFIFVLIHLAHFTLFWLNPEYAGLHDAAGRHDVYKMVVLAFSNLWYSGFYIVAMAFLALHLRQAFSGMFQSFGLADGPCLDALKKAGLAFSLLIFLGYVSIPAAVMAGALKLPAGAAS